MGRALGQARKPEREGGEDGILQERGGQGAYHVPAVLWNGEDLDRWEKE